MRISLVTDQVFTGMSPGAFDGGHCVCIVGYNDADGCWIGKNRLERPMGRERLFPHRVWKLRDRCINVERRRYYTSARRTVKYPKERD